MICEYSIGEFSVSGRRPSRQSRSSSRSRTRSRTRSRERRRYYHGIFIYIRVIGGLVTEGLRDAGWSIIHQSPATLQPFYLCKPSLADLRRLIVALSYFQTVQTSSMPWSQGSILWTKRRISRSCFGAHGLSSCVHDALASL